MMEHTSRPGKRVLIITYYWPPSGGSGVQRWLKFSKYLRDFGWEPIIYTPENPEMPAEDASLERDIPAGITILKTPIVEPYSVYKWMTGRRKSDKIGAGFTSVSGKKSRLERMARWVRGNLFIPDARRFWIRPSVKYLQRWLKEHPVDLIVSTGPPHSMHLIARKLKAKTGIPWVADFRDPWTRIDFYQDLLPGKAADRLHHELERSVVGEADRVVVVSPTMAKEFSSDHHRPIDVITNGYDEDDIRGKQPLPAEDPYFSIAHIGTAPPSRNPVALWAAIKELLDEEALDRDKIRIRFVGHVDHTILAAANNADLADIVEIIPYVPHEEVSGWLRNSSVLLLLLNNTPGVNGILTGKFFEYLASGRPILCIGPVESDVAAIIQETASGICIPKSDVQAIKTWIKQAYDQHPHHVTPNAIISRYSRKALTEQMSVIFNQVINP